MFVGCEEKGCRRKTAQWDNGVIEQPRTGGATPVVTMVDADPPADSVVAVVGVMLAEQRDDNLPGQAVRAEFEVPSAGDAGRHEPDGNHHAQ